MGLNVAKGNMYSFITHTWNTVKGECYHDCSYCYMKRFGKQNPVHFDKKELKTDLGTGNFIFVGSSNDLFSLGTKYPWIEQTIKHCKAYPENTYLFQSKDPWGMAKYNLPKNSVVCTTIETNKNYQDIMGESPDPKDRAERFSTLLYDKYITIEPVMDFTSGFLDLIKKCNPIQVNIGADSGGNNLPEPAACKLEWLISELRKFTVVNIKKNLKRLYKVEFDERNI